MLVEFWKNRDKAATTKTLLDLAQSGLLDLAVTSRIMFNRHGRVKNHPDWDHIHGHYLKGRDVFLTWDRPLLDAAPELKAQLGIVVMKPEDFLSCFS